jgi:tRNA-dihydrouridine synthase 3
MALLDLSSEELIARAIAPIKREFIVQGMVRKPDEGAAGMVQEKKSKNSKKKVREARVWGAAGRVQLPPAPAAQAAADSPHPPARSQELLQQRGNELCVNFAAGRCQYGDRCKFNHDVGAYLRTKPPDLPGTCPFACLDACPYGARGAGCVALGAWRSAAV